MEAGSAVRRKKSGQKREKEEEKEAAPTERAAGAAKRALEGPKGRKGGESQKKAGEEKSGQKKKEKDAAPTERAEGAAKGVPEGPKGRKGGESQKKAGEEKGMEKSGPMKKEKEEKAAPTERAEGAAKGVPEGPKGRKRGESQKKKGGVVDKGLEKSWEKEEEAPPTERATEGPKGRKGDGGEKGIEKKRSSRAKEGEAVSRAAPKGQEAKEAEPSSGARRKSLPRGAAPAPAPSASSPSPATALPALRPVLEGLRLEKEARSKAAEQVNLLRDRLKIAVRKEPCFKAVEVFSAGSYYERVKICSPDEFDIMLKIPKVRLELEPCEAVASSGAFYYVKLKRDPANKELKQFCDDHERLSSSRMLLALRNIIIDEAKKMTDMNVSVEKKRPGSPAVTVLIGSPPSVISVDIILGLEFHHPKWCSSTENGLGIEEWMGTKVKKSLRSEPLYLVPKKFKDGKCFTDNTWRLSFSNIEKMLLQNHGQTKTCCEIKGEKCCRKDCFKLMKYLLLQLQTKHENRNQFEKFCSYHVKTAFFHACVKWPKDSDWLLANLDECFNRLLYYFLDCLKEAKLPHFFIPGFNLFSEESIDRTKRNALVKTIEKEINNRLPIFFN